MAEVSAPWDLETPTIIPLAVLDHLDLGILTITQAVEQDPLVPVTPTTGQAVEQDLLDPATLTTILETVPAHWDQEIQITTREAELDPVDRATAVLVETAMADLVEATDAPRITTDLIVMSTDEDEEGAAEEAEEEDEDAEDMAEEGGDRAKSTTIIEEMEITDDPEVSMVLPECINMNLLTDVYDFTIINSVITKLILVVVAIFKIVS